MDVRVRDDGGIPGNELQFLRTVPTERRGDTDVIRKKAGPQTYGQHQQ
jgi:hypothetical protein